MRARLIVVVISLGLLMSYRLGGIVTAVAMAHPEFALFPQMAPDEAASASSSSVLSPFPSLQANAPVVRSNIIVNDPQFPFPAGLIGRSEL